MPGSISGSPSGETGAGDAMCADAGPSRRARLVSTLCADATPGAPRTPLPEAGRGRSLQARGRFEQPVRRAHIWLRREKGTPKIGWPAFDELRRAPTFVTAFYRFWLFGSAAPEAAKGGQNQQRPGSAFQIRSPIWRWNLIRPMRVRSTLNRLRPNRVLCLCETKMLLEHPQ